jgi:isopentenyl-diphosphate Delta-isomerase
MPRLLVLVDPFGTVVGHQEVAAAHHNPGQLHLACSAVVFGPNNTVLMQRRAEAKPTFGGRWSNTCCTHPFPDESPHHAAQRRLQEELGLRVSLTPAGSFRYRAEDPDTGFVEHELDHINIGFVADPDQAQLILDPAEVAEAAWMTPDDIKRHQAQLTPWCDMVLRIASEARSSVI